MEMHVVLHEERQVVRAGTYHWAAPHSKRHSPLSSASQKCVKPQPHCRRLCIDFSQVFVTCGDAYVPSSGQDYTIVQAALGF
eukprot:365299-Chlamydomonas_euryale.AAC.11